MSLRVTADPDRLEVYAEEVHLLTGLTLAEVDDYQSAVHAYNSAGPHHLGNRVPDRSGELRATVEDLAGLGRLLSGFAAALRQVDAGYGALPRGPGDVRSAEVDDDFATLVAANVALPGATAAQARRFAETLRGAAAGDPSARERLRQAGDTALLAIRTLDALESARVAGTSLVRSLVQARRLLYAGLELDGALNAHRDVWGSLPSPALTAAQNRVLQARLAVREFRHQRAATAAIPRLRATVADHAVALRTNRPLTTIGADLAAQFPRTMTTLAKGGRALGFVGAGFNLYDGYRDVREEDWGGVASNSAAILGSGLMLTPAAPLGAALVVGSLIYEHRSFLGDVGRGIGNVLWG